MWPDHKPQRPHCNKHGQYLYVFILRLGESGFILSEHFCLPVIAATWRSEQYAPICTVNRQTGTSLNSSSRSTKVSFFWPSLEVSVPKTLSVQWFCGPSQRDTAPFSHVGYMISPSPFIFQTVTSFSAGFKSSSVVAMVCNCYSWDKEGRKHMW